MTAPTSPSFDAAFLDQYYDEAATAQSHSSPLSSALSSAPSDLRAQIFSGSRSYSASYLSSSPAGSGTTLPDAYKRKKKPRTGHCWLPCHGEEVMISGKTKSMIPPVQTDPVRGRAWSCQVSPEGRTGQGPRLAVLDWTGLVWTSPNGIIFINFKVDHKLKK